MSGVVVPRRRPLFRRVIRVDDEFRNSRDRVTEGGVVGRKIDRRGLSPRQLHRLLHRVPHFRSRFQRAVVSAIYPLISCFGNLGPRYAAESEVAGQLTPWERHLTSLNRVQRGMLLEYSLPNSCDQLSDEERLFRIVKGLYVIIQGLEQTEQWQNQPLTVLVGPEQAGRVMDPRERTRGVLRIGMVDRNQRILSVSFDLVHGPGQFADEELVDDYLRKRIAQAEVSNAPCSVLIDVAPVSRTGFPSSYANFPGAWIRLGVSTCRSMILSTADHLVLDGALHGDLVHSVWQSFVAKPTGSLRGADRNISKESASSVRSTTENLPAWELPSDPQATDPPVTMVLQQRVVMCELLSSILTAIRDCGADSNLTVLTTIQKRGPHTNSQIPNRGHRVLPVLMHTPAPEKVEQLRTEIRRMSLRGWRTLLPRVFDKLYAPNVGCRLQYYFSQISHRLPFLEKPPLWFRGDCQLSAPPVLMVSRDEFDNLSLIRATTVNSPVNGPAVHIMQVECKESGRRKTFVNFDGTGSWRDVPKLTELRRRTMLRLQSEVG